VKVKISAPHINLVFVRAIRVPKIIKVDGNLTTFWRKQFCTVFWDTV